MSHSKARTFFWLFVFSLYLLLLVQVRRYRDRSDWTFFIHLSRQLMAGNFSNIYQEKEYGRFYFYYGPVSLLLLSPAILIGDAMGLGMMIPPCWQVATEKCR